MICDTASLSQRPQVCLFVCFLDFLFKKEREGYTHRTEADEPVALQLGNVQILRVTDYFHVCQINMQYNFMLILSQTIKEEQTNLEHEVLGNITVGKTKHS